MNNFASGWKRSYYGKGDVIVYRLNRDGAVPPGGTPVFGASVLMLLYGDAFWPTYTTGDNTGLIATDSMKNFIQRETLAFEGSGVENLCRFLGQKFLATYPQVEGLQVSAEDIPYSALPLGSGFSPSGQERAMARVEITGSRIVEATSGLRNFKLLRLGGSAFAGFVRDEYTTLPDVANRPLHMWLDLEWRCTRPEDVFTDGATAKQVRTIVHDVFERFESGSIQQVIYQMGTRLMKELPDIAEVHLEATNRTWDAIVERGDARGVFTEPRPPYGCLGLRLTR